MTEDYVSRKELDNTLLLLAISHIDNVYRSVYLGSLMALSGGIISSSNEILKCLKNEIETAKKLAYFIVSVGHREDDEVIQEYKSIIDEHIENCHRTKIDTFNKAINNRLPIESLVNAGIEDWLIDKVFGK